MASVKRTASGVQGSTEAEASSHQTRKRCRKTEVVEGSSDQPQGGRKVEIVEGSSDQPKGGGRKTKKQERDTKRYHNMKDGAQKYKEMGPQMEILENKFAELERELETQKNDAKEVEILKNKFAELERELKDQKNETKEWRVELAEVKSVRLPAITQETKTMKEELEMEKNDNKKRESLFQFLQSKLKENDGEIPLDYEFLDGKENMSSEGILNGENLMTDSEYPPELFDLVGMPRQEILPELEKIRDNIEELKRENERQYEELKRENERRCEELKRENEGLRRENKRLNSRITAIETHKNKS